MKIRELIEQLKKLDPESEIYLSQPAHDHHRRVLAVPLKKISRENALHSNYFQAAVIDDPLDRRQVDDDPDDFNPKDRLRNIPVLGA